MDKKSISHSAWKCQHHLVFIPKYRKKKLYGQVCANVRDIIKTLCSYKGVEIVEGIVCIDHVHLCVSISPVELVVGDLRFFVAKEVTIKIVDTEYDTTYNISRRYSKCQSGINY